MKAFLQWLSLLMFQLTRITDKHVTEIGQRAKYLRYKAYLLPVRFKDGTYGILESGLIFMREVVPDDEALTAALRSSVRMLRIQDNIGSGRIYVFGADEHGEFRVCIYYGEKKIEWGSKDRLERPIARPQPA